MITLRPANRGDVEAGGRLTYAAFTGAAHEHGFESEYEEVDDASRAIEHRLRDGWVLVAEDGDQLVGVAGLSEEAPVGSIGPVAVAPSHEGQGVGSQLIAGLIEIADRERLSPIRLMQASYQVRSLALYLRHGFLVQIPTVVMSGKPFEIVRPPSVRPARPADVAACMAIGREVIGWERRAELLTSIDEGFALVVEDDFGAVRSYSAGLGFLGHTVARTLDDAELLVRSAKSFGGLGFLCPTDSPIADRLLSIGLQPRAAYQLMVKGSWTPPRGTYFPAISG